MTRRPTLGPRASSLMEGNRLFMLFFFLAFLSLMRTQRCSEWQEVVSLTLRKKANTAVSLRAAVFCGKVVRRNEPGQ